MEIIDVGTAFERCVDALAHDPFFADVEFVRHAVRRAKRASALVVAGAINARLDACDAPYVLEVESAGLDRPLTKPGDYERFSGRNAKIVTTLFVKGAKTHRGVLRGVRGTNVVLETATGELPLPLATIRIAHLEYDVRNDLNRHKKAGQKNG
ncbi:MAG: hypothetical protein M1314_01760 [Firmicutes bacterium]|nr:hypothetical protein [Bacillota bacterium]